MKIQLQKMTDHEYSVYSDRLEKQLFQSTLWKNAAVIGLTISQNREPNTRNIIRRAWSEGKQAVIPKCFPAERKMEFRVLTSFDQLETVYYGLKEPIREMTALADKRSIDAIAVPGLCFDSRGYRIGYGGGYYDRFLEDYRGQTVSLAFSFQVLPLVPAEPFDVPVQRIITEKEVLHCCD